MGTTRPWASRTATVTTETSQPSARMVLRSGMSATAAGVPVVTPSWSRPPGRCDNRPPGAFLSRKARCPIQHGLNIERLLSQTDAIEEQFHHIAIAINPDIDRLSGVRPVPVRENVQHGFDRPVGLVIIIIVLRKTAGVHHAKMRVDVGPPVRRRLAAIIKAGPDEPARRPGPGMEIWAPDFRRSPLLRFEIVTDEQ